MRQLFTHTYARRAKKNDGGETWQCGFELRQAFGEIRRKIGAGEELTFVSLEETVREAALKTAARFLGRFYTNELPALLGLSNAPGGCGRREVTVLSTVGEITYSRPYVTGPDGKRSFPLDTAMGVVAGCTPAMASLLSRAGAMNQSYESAGENASKMMGVHVEGRRIHRVVDAVSDEELKWIAERPVESCPNGGILNIQADMTGLPLRKEDLVGIKGHDGKDPKKKQIKVGAVFLQEENAEKEMQRIPESTTRVAEFSDWRDFKDKLYGEAVRRGYNDAARVAFVSDGADWIWDMATDRFKGAVQIVDFFHACEHLGALCELIHPEKGEAYSALFEERRRMLKKWGVNSMIAYFENLAVGHKRSEAINSELGYFRHHQERMQYHKFRKAGYFIGSGVIEGTCKCLVNQRCDLAGQRWHPESSQKVLAIRAAVMDRLHDAYWQARSAFRRAA